MSKTSTPTDPDYTRPKPDFELPEGYGSEADFLAEMREDFTADLEFDKFNRDAALEDLAFATGNQWTDAVRSKREAAGKPVLTINRIMAFLAQIIGSRRLNDTNVKFSPDNGGTKAVAQIREDIFRQVQKDSRANAAYDNALMGCVSCGIGNFELSLEYENMDVFDQSMRVKPIMDHLGVIWDRRLADPTGKDAQRCFVVDTMTDKDFRAEYPWATPADIVADASLLNQVLAQGWFEAGDVRIVSYWRMRSEKRVLAMMTDGTVQDITDEDDPEELANIAFRPDGSPFVREVMRPYAQKYICSGTDILEGPYNLPIDRIPVFRVPGWEIRLGTRVFRFGLVRFLKDPQRLHNFFRSVMAEKLMQSPKAVWTASNEAVAGREQAWRDSHLSDDPLLIWNQESGQEPKRVPPAQMDQALLQQAEISSQDIKDVSNIHEANLGMPSNEVSGVAIQARQRVSDTGSIIYHDNLTQAQEECGRVADQLFPIVYDTPRIVKTLGADAKENLQVINMIGNPDSIDITEGKYSVTAVTGPAYATKQVEQAEIMLKMANAMPQLLSLAGDLIVEAQDWPMAKDIAARLKRAIPPNILSPEELSPEKQAAMAQGQQAAQAEAKIKMAAATADYINKASQARLNDARAQREQVDASLAPGKLQNDSIRTATDATKAEVDAHLEVLKLPS